MFTEAVMDPVTLTLARYLLGTSCRLFTTSTFVKRGRASSTPLHVDSQGNPPPLYPFSVVCNISWILTDYTEENGTFAIVPGSHRYCRHPMQSEWPKVMGGTGENICIPVEAKAWFADRLYRQHLARRTYPKADASLRVHVVTGFCRNYLLPAESYRDYPEGRCRSARSGIRPSPRAHGTKQGYTVEGPKGENIASLARANVTPSA